MKKEHYGFGEPIEFRGRCGGGASRVPGAKSDVLLPTMVDPSSTNSFVVRIAPRALHTNTKSASAIEPCPQLEYLYCSEDVIAPSPLPSTSTNLSYYLSYIFTTLESIARPTSPDHGASPTPPFPNLGALLYLCFGRQIARI